MLIYNILWFLMWVSALINSVRWVWRKVTGYWRRENAKLNAIIREAKHDDTP